MSFRILFIVTVLLFSSFTLSTTNQKKVDSKALSELYFSYINKSIKIHTSTTPVLHVNDTITHVNRIPVVTKGLSSLLNKENHEIIIPLIDNEISIDDGFKFLGFVSVRLIEPQELSIERIMTGQQTKTERLSVTVTYPTSSSQQGKRAEDSHKSSEYTINRQGDVTPNQPPHIPLTSTSTTTTTTATTATATATTPVTNDKQETANRVLQELPSNMGSTNNENKDRLKTTSIPPTSETVTLNSQHQQPPMPPTFSSSSSSTSRSSTVNAVTAATSSTTTLTAANTASSSSSSTSSLSASDPTSNIIDQFYGVGKMYPEPYLAGKIPSQNIIERNQYMNKNIPYIYSIRFRTGPLGLSFDNQSPDGTYVEKVLPRELAAESGVNVGDQLIAVNEHNISTQSARIAVRVLSALSYPKILVFQTKVALHDPVLEAQKIASRTYNLTIIYPPSLISTSQIRIPEWSPPISNTTDSHICPIYYLHSPSDVYGCTYDENRKELQLRDDILSMNNHTYTPMFPEYNITSDIRRMDMLSLLYMEAGRIQLPIQIYSMGIVKRGLCTFVEKSLHMQSADANIGIIVNNNKYEIIDMPSGGEKTDSLNTAMAMISETEGDLIQLSASYPNQEILALITPSNNASLSAPCQSIQHMAHHLLSYWPRLTPKIDNDMILKASLEKLAKKQRTKESHGGQLAISGENGWIYFDYHSALFGPQYLPTYPIPFKVVQPIYGCDPNKYSVRIQEYIVGILRGGGCSFGIKIINAQKLGAKAVVIINNDDTPIMRLMASKDEIALINIPVVMVSKRFYYYLTYDVKPFYQKNQFIIQFFNSSYIQEYEKIDDKKVSMTVLPKN